MLVEKNPPQVIVVAAGVGYEIDVPMSTFYHLPRTGEEVALLTHLVVREDAHLLFGFLTANERAAFRQLLKISGVGPKVALSVLSGLSVDDSRRGGGRPPPSTTTRSSRRRTSTSPSSRRRARATSSAASTSRAPASPA